MCSLVLSCVSSNDLRDLGDLKLVRATNLDESLDIWLDDEGGIVEVLGVAERWNGDSLWEEVQSLSLKRDVATWSV